MYSIYIDTNRALMILKSISYSLWFLGLLEGGGEGVCSYMLAWTSFSHIFREGNNCVDKLANLSVDNKLGIFWYTAVLRPCLSLDIFHNI